MPPPRRSVRRLRARDLLGGVGPPTPSAPSTPRLLVAPAPPLFSLRGSLALLVLKPPPPALAASLLSSSRLSHSALWPNTASCFIWSLPIPLPHPQLVVSPPSPLPPARGPLLHSACSAVASSSPFLASCQRSSLVLPQSLRSCMPGTVAFCCLPSR